MVCKILMSIYNALSTIHHILYTIGSMPYFNLLVYVVLWAPIVDSSVSDAPVKQDKAMKPFTDRAVRTVNEAGCSYQVV